MKKILAGLFLGIASFSLVHAEEIIPPEGGQRVILGVTAYYSPLPNQSKYSLGNYEAEIRMNGRGTNGADGTEVYPGMLAAPVNYPFGTKIFLPGLGVGEVHDRGGAIVNAGNRGEHYDRIDVWMGRGEGGLARALSWGKRNVEAVIWFPFEKNIPATTFSFADFPLATLSALPTTPIGKIAAPLFAEIDHVFELYPAGLSRDSNGESVKNLQKFLAQNGMYDGDISGVFDQETEGAVFAFQKSKGIVAKKEAWGAGVFGPQTQTALFSLLSDREKTLRGEKKPEIQSFEIVGKTPQKVIAKSESPPQESFVVKEFSPREMPQGAAVAGSRRDIGKMMSAEF